LTDNAPLNEASNYIVFIFAADRVSLNSKCQAKVVFHEGLVRDDKGTPNTKPQQQAASAP
jgi:hypothetical protein